MECIEDSYDDYPKAATENAKIALRYAEENGWGSCGTPVGKARANQLAKGEPITRSTIARMAAFERHRQNSQKELGDGCGRLMWLAWGGDAGVEWATRKLKQIDNNVNKNQILSSTATSINKQNGKIQILKQKRQLYKQSHQMKCVKSLSDSAFHSELKLHPLIKKNSIYLN